MEPRVGPLRRWTPLVAIPILVGTLAHSCAAQRRHDEDLSKLRGELGELRRERHAPRAAVPPSPPGTDARPTNDAVAEAASADAFEGQDPEPRETQREQMRNRDAEQLARYDARFEGELSDRGWSAAAEAQLGAVARAALSPGASIGELRCRSSLCKMTTVHPDSNAASAFFLNYIGPDAGWTGGIRNFTSPDAAGRLRITSFFFRDGHPMTP